MPTAATGLELDSELKDLHDVLSEWTRLYDQAAMIFPQGQKAWYCEGTLRTLLSAAAWRVGVPSIAEAKVSRDRPTSGSGAGRVDLVAELPGGRTAVEGKIHWFDNLGAFEIVLDRLDHARDDARSLGPLQFPRRLAIVFGVVERGDMELWQLLASALERARRDKPALLAWTMSGVADASVRFPGCVVVGQMVQ